MRQLLWIALMGVVVGSLGASVGCDTWSLQSDQKAKDAVLALKKLEATTDTGMSYHDYSVALGEANFSVKQFLEGGKANLKPEFSGSLRNSIKWYRAAEETWGRQIEAPVVLGFCDSHGLPSFSVKEFCDAYPELITTVPGKLPRTGRSLGSAIAEVPLSIMLEEPVIVAGKESKGSPGLIYKFAILESWRRASFEVENAQRILNGNKPEKAEAASFKATKRAESDYLGNVAMKSLESNR